ncbi:NAD(P)-dependent oxidoreductase [Bifidobacterium bombi]|uniref:Putative NADH-flavin reductase n=1 Tax=Bifidobacterium bombi DSM 19703 TaxID=1341695 RepID=A0A086BP63_9BIFI|nr:NAD(P)H-binding protein [Bifidobacterium bombi]KFF30727.1 putative NADH-flavin reductase [Bifidobacterium bombi DSM 19703]
MSRKIAVVGANGKEGRLIVTEAVKRGMDVTAVVRHGNSTLAQHAMVRDLFDLTDADLQGFDAVVDAFGTTPDKADEHISSLRHLCDVLSGSRTRLLVIGGAGSLYTDKAHVAKLSDEFPDDIKAIPVAMGHALDALRKRGDVRWTYLSPAADFRATGETKGRYVLAGEEYSTDSDGVSAISYADFATAMVDEIESDRPHERERISVRW